MLGYRVVVRANSLFHSRFKDVARGTTFALHRWKWHVGVFSSARNCSVFEFGGQCQAAQRGLVEAGFSTSSQCWSSKLEKSLHPTSKDKDSGKPWLKIHYKTLCTDCPAATSDDHARTCSRAERTPISRRAEQLQRYCQEGQLDRAYDVLLRLDTVPSVEIYRILLRACTAQKALSQAKQVHAHLAKHGLESTRYLGDSVVKTLVKCGSVDDALRVFNGLLHPTVVSWTAIISGYANNGQGRKALEMYHRMQLEGVQPNSYTFVSVLKACSSMVDLGAGKLIHAEVIKHNWQSDLFVSTCLVGMYVKCGSMADAQDVFDKLSQRNVVVWTVMFAAYAQQDQAEMALKLYQLMLEEGVSPDVRTFVTVLEACGSLADKEEKGVFEGWSVKMEALTKAKALHAEAQRRGHQQDVFVGSALISVYGKVSSTLDARHVFDGLPEPNVVAWTAIFAAYAEQDQAGVVLEMYELMLGANVSPDAHALISAVQACGYSVEKVEGVEHYMKVKCLQKVKAIHAEAHRRRDYESNAHLASALISVYGKCGSIMDVDNVFSRLPERDVVAWTALVAAHVQQGNGGKALELYTQMLQEGVDPNNCTFGSALRACGMLAEEEDNCLVDGQPMKACALSKVRAVHVEAQRNGHSLDVVLDSILMSVYAKCGSLLDARNVFDVLPKRDVVVWNTMLAAYIDHGQEKDALELYRQMQGEGVSVDDITVVCVLQACSSIGGLDACRQMHHALLASGNPLSPLVTSALVQSYGRCSSMLDAQNVFDQVSQPDVVLWTSLIAGYARQGNCWASLLCYERMQLAGMDPNGVTFLSILSACSHAGLVDRGVEYFHSMSRDYGITPEIEHYVCMVDLLGRAGHFAELEHLLCSMPMQPDVALWLCLLGACQKHGKVALGKRAFDGAVSLESTHASAYVLMCNIYADAGLWDLAHQVQQLRQKAGAWKKPGQSWLEHDQDIHSFWVGGQNATSR